MYGYIYETTNLVNGKKYVGQKKSKVFLKEEYLGSGKLILLAIKKYGKENFSIKLIEECNTREELDEREIYWIANLRKNYSPSMIYNIADGAEKNSDLAIGRKSYNKGKIAMHKNNVVTYIYKNDLEKYTNKGWKKGNPKNIIWQTNQSNSRKNYYKVKVNDTEYIVKGKSDIHSILLENYGCDISETQIKLLVGRCTPFKANKNKHSKIKGLTITKLDKEVMKNAKHR